MSTAKKMESMTNAQLVEVYNGLSPAKTIKAWKGKKGVLIEKILVAQKQSDSVETAVKPKKARKAQSTTGTKKQRTGEIRGLCERMLTTVVYHENKSKDVGDDNQLKNPGKNTRPVGLPFSAILSEVHATFPNANTSYACLRWYAVHLRHAGVSLPRRPKSSWK